MGENEVVVAPSYSNKKGEQLSLIDLRFRKVTEISVKGLSHGQPTVVTLSDPNGISFDFDYRFKEVHAIAFFSQEEEFRKIKEREIDQNTLFVVDSRNQFQPYQLMFCLPNLTVIDWE